MNTGTTTITGNTVANLYSAFTGTASSKADGIYTSTGSNIIQNNTVRNISTGSATTVTGIQQLSTTSGTSQTVTGNTVYNLSNTNASTAVIIKGIDFSGPNSGTNLVSGNFVHSFTLSSASNNSEIDGIVVNAGLTTCSNNIINLGAGVPSGYKINGINDYSGPANNSSIYFNSV